jgi:hypothetical protein
MFSPSRLLSFAHWFAGHKRKHRFMRDKRFVPQTWANSAARNNFSRKRHFKTNRWNYVTAYKDMP